MIKRVNGKRQTSDSISEFRKLEKKEIKTAQNKFFWTKNYVKLQIYIMCKNDEQ